MCPQFFPGWIRDRIIIIIIIIMIIIIIIDTYIARYSLIAQSAVH